mgnify:FL=1
MFALTRLRRRPSCCLWLRTKAPVAGTAALAIALAYPTPSLAQGAGTGPVNPDGSVILLREVPHRPAIEPGSGDAHWVETTPSRAFASALDLGLSVLDDEQASQVRSTAGNIDLTVADAAVGQAAGHMIGSALSGAGLADLNQQGGGSIGGSIRGSVDAGVAAATSGIGSGMGALSGALSNLSGGSGRMGL